MKRWMFLALCLSVGSLAWASSRTVMNVSYDADLSHVALNDQTLYFSKDVVEFPDWATKAPSEKSFLNLYPGYQEPDIPVPVDGELKKIHEGLTVFRARYTFLLDKAFSTINVPALVNLGLWQDIDPTMNLQSINPADVVTVKDSAKYAYMKPANRQWCSDAGALCLTSHYDYPSIVQTAIKFYNLKQKLEGLPAKDSFLKTQSELRYVSPEQLSKIGDIQALTGFHSPVAGAVEQNIFYLNMIIQYAKVLVVFQQDPQNVNQTVVSTFLVFGIERKWYEPTGFRHKILSLVHTTAADIFNGTGPKLADDGILSGLPNYTQSLIERIIDKLSR